MTSSMTTYFATMNAKMDEGWKLTDYSCPECKFSCLCKQEPEIQLFCCKCNKDVEMTQPEEELEEQNEVLEKQQDDVEFIQSPTKKKDNENAIKRMGDLLLKGWTMLNDSCDACHTPLMKNKKKEIQCINQECSVYQLLNQSQLPQVQQTQKTEKIPEKKIKQEQNEKIPQQIQEIKQEKMMDLDVYDEPNPYDDYHVPVVIKKNELQDKGIKLMGDYLLTGWTMLADSCQLCCIPMMSKKGVKICVGCEAATKSKGQKQLQLKNDDQCCSIVEIPLSQSKNIPNQPQQQRGQLSLDCEKPLLKLQYEQPENSVQVQGQKKQVSFKSQQLEIQPDQQLVQEQQKNSQNQQPFQGAQRNVRNNVGVQMDHSSTYYQESEEFYSLTNQMLMKSLKMYSQKLDQCSSVVEMDSIISGPIQNLIKARQDLEIARQKFDY